MKVFDWLRNLFRNMRGRRATTISNREVLAVLDRQSNDLNEKLSRLIEAFDNQSQLLAHKFDRMEAGLANRSALLTEKLSAVIAGSDNQSSLLNEKLSALVQGSITQSQLLVTKFDQILAGLNNQSSLLSDKLGALGKGSSTQSELLDEKLSALAKASMNQSQLLGAKFDQVLAGLNNQSQLLSEKLSALVQGSSTQSELLDVKFEQVVIGLNNQSSLLNGKLSTLIETFRNKSQSLRSIPPPARFSIMHSRMKGLDEEQYEEENNLPQVSIVCVTYNQEKFVLDAIRGLLQQTFHPIDIIILDDASPDATAQIITAELDRQPQRTDIRFIRNEQNLGVRDNILKGISLAQGKFIILACGDDIMLPTRVEKMVKVWRDEKVSLVTANAIYIDENSTELDRFFRAPDQPYDETFETLARDGSNALCFGAGIGFERRLFDDAGWLRGYPSVLDIMLPFSACLAKGARFIPEPLLKYRVGPQNTSLSLAAESSTGIDKLMIEFNISCCHIEQSTLMEAELDRLNEKDPTRYSEIARQIRPLIGVQRSEMSRKLVRTRIELNKIGVTRLIGETRPQFAILSS